MTTHPCLYCEAEAFLAVGVSCCQARRDVDELAASVEVLVTALTWYADPRSHEPLETIAGGRRHATPMAADGGALAAAALGAELRLDAHVANLREPDPAKHTEIQF